MFLLQLVSISRFRDSNLGHPVHTQPLVKIFMHDVKAIFFSLFYYYYYFLLKDDSCTFVCPRWHAIARYVCVCVCVKLTFRFALLQSKQHSAGFAGSAEGVPDNSGNLQMRPRVSAKARTGLQLRPQGMFSPNIFTRVRGHDRPVYSVSVKLPQLLSYEYTRRLLVIS